MNKIYKLILFYLVCMYIMWLFWVFYIVILNMVINRYLLVVMESDVYLNCLCMVIIIIGKNIMILLWLVRYIVKNIYI